MQNDELNALVDRKKKGEEGLGSVILERIARDVYDRPRLYGLKSEDEVGEVFDRYWTRIEKLADRYEDIGCGFQAFLVTSIRYMARSIRRQRAWRHDREDTYNAGIKESLRDEIERAESVPAIPRHRRTVAGVPSRDDRGISATAFRRRMLFICVKCANVLDDGEAESIARAVGLDAAELLGALSRARASGLGLRLRTESRRRGRDAAWLRMGTASRRLAREVDSDTRRYLAESIDRDRGLYRRAVRLISRSRPILSNKAVADLLGVPKGTVDCGVRRIIKRFEALYPDGQDV